MITAGAFILFLYLLLILWVISGTHRLPSFTPTATAPQTRFSIVVAFKDEARNLPVLLDSLQHLRYPSHLYEIIPVNDHSTDDFQSVISNYPVRWLPNSGQGKKQALTTGIAQARHEWIITTDADCVVPENLLSVLNAVIRTQSLKMLLLPVRFPDSPRFLDQFQQIEFLSLQAVTMAGVYRQKAFLANGAGLVFEKKAFYDLNAYEGNAHIASGDDVFLLEKFQNHYPAQIAFVKNNKAVILTQAQKSWRDLIQQKIRWASKTRHYQSRLPKLTGIIAALSNLTMAAAWFLLATDLGFAGLILVKLFADAALFYTANRFYKARINPFYWLLSFLIYPWYAAYVFLKSLQGTYRWKGKSYSA